MATDTIKLGDLLNELQLRIVDSIMTSASTNKHKSLASFLRSLRPPLEDKGVLPDYLAYQIEYAYLRVKQTSEPSISKGDGPGTEQSHDSGSLRSPSSSQRASSAATHDSKEDALAGSRTSHHTHSQPENGGACARSLRSPRTRQCQDLNNSTNNENPF